MFYLKITVGSSVHPAFRISDRDLDMKKLTVYIMHKSKSRVQILHLRAVRISSGLLTIPHATLL